MYSLIDPNSRPPRFFQGFGEQNKFLFTTNIESYVPFETSQEAAQYVELNCPEDLSLQVVKLARVGEKLCIVKFMDIIQGHAQPPTKEEIELVKQALENFRKNPVTYSLDHLKNKHQRKRV